MMGTGGHGGVAAGSGGSPGLGGSGGEGGTSSGSAGANGGGSAGSLPACAVATRPQDPVDSADGGYHDVRSHVCNNVDPSGAWVVAEAFTWGDAGADTDGGLPAALPQGGVVLDGDYDLVRLFYPGPNPDIDPTRRTFRVFDNGTYIERAVLMQDPIADGGMIDSWYDTTESPSGIDLGSESVCGTVVTTDDYTAEGDTLTLYVFAGSLDPSPIGIDVYRRTCTRP
jgi:hypothetical protein